jgi:hypothetical protein
LKIGLCIKYFQVFFKKPKKTYNTRMFENFGSMSLLGRNSKWSGLFLESFRGQMLFKNKVQWLDLASHLWPPLVRLPLAKMVQVHYDFVVKYCKLHLNSSSKNYYWFLQYMANDNGNVCNVMPSLSIKYFESFYFIISFYSHFVN